MPPLRGDEDPIGTNIGHKAQTKGRYQPLAKSARAMLRLCEVSYREINASDPATKADIDKFQAVSGESSDYPQVYIEDGDTAVHWPF